VHEKNLTSGSSQHSHSTSSHMYFPFIHSVLFVRFQVLTGEYEGDSLVGYSIM
jgi:hypothetical protein